MAQFNLCFRQDIKKQLHVNDALAKQYAQHLNQFEAPPAFLIVFFFMDPLDMLLTATSRAFGY